MFGVGLPGKRPWGRNRLAGGSMLRVGEWGGTSMGRYVCHGAGPGPGGRDTPWRCPQHRHPHPPGAEPPLTISSSLQDSISCTYPGRPASRTPPSRLPMGTRKSCEAAPLSAQMREDSDIPGPRRGGPAHFLMVPWEPAGLGFQLHTHVCSVGTATRRQPGS